MIATGAHYRKLDVPRLEEFEGTSVYYAATADRGAALPRRSGRGRRRRQLGRPGGGVPVRATRRRCTCSSASDDLGAGHVALPRRPHRAHRERAGACCTPRCASCSATTRSRRSSSRTTGPATAARSRRARCSCSSAPRRTPTGWATARARRSAASSSPAATSRRRPGIAPTSPPRAAAARDEPARRLRRRRRAQRLDQAGRLGRRRGLDGDPARLGAPGGRARARPPLWQRGPGEG